MKVKIIIGASSAYACITGETYTLDVALLGGRSASASLRQSAADLRAEIDSKEERAERMLAAAEILERIG